MKENKLQKIYKSIMLVILTAAITFIITSVVMYNEFGKEKVKVVSTTDNISRTFQMFRRYINEKYIGELDDEKMLESAIKGYVAGLEDEYSEYITKEEMKEYMEDAMGNYVGIGVYIANNTETNQIMVLMPIKGSPAEEVGIKAGDILTKVDGIAYTGEQLNEASNALKKEEGTKVKVEVIRDGKNIEFDITRKAIKINHIETELINDRIGYIQITTFDEGCYDEFSQKWQELSKADLKGVVIDLRNNGGGIVEEALNIADLFVDKDKTLLITKGKKDGEKIEKSKKDKKIDMPICILINENTASSSEILAAAIKENNDNVKLIGETTYGKGVIQTIYTLTDGSGLKLTTNEYFTPKHNAINKVGIKPDIEVKLPEGEDYYTITRETDTQLQRALDEII